MFSSRICLLDYARIMTSKNELDDSADIFQKTMLDRYTDRPDNHLQNGK